MTPFYALLGACCGVVVSLLWCSVSLHRRVRLLEERADSAADHASSQASELRRLVDANRKTLLPKASPYGLCALAGVEDICDAEKRAAARIDALAEALGYQYEGPQTSEAKYIVKGGPEPGN